MEPTTHSAAQSDNGNAFEIPELQSQTVDRDQHNTERQTALPRLTAVPHSFTRRMLSTALDLPPWARLPSSLLSDAFLDSLRTALLLSEASLPATIRMNASWDLLRACSVSRCKRCSSELQSENVLRNTLTGRAACSVTMVAALWPDRFRNGTLRTVACEEKAESASEPMPVDDLRLDLQPQPPNPFSSYSVPSLSRSCPTQNISPLLNSFSCTRPSPDRSSAPALLRLSCSEFKSSSRVPASSTSLPPN